MDSDGIQPLIKLLRSGSDGAKRYSSLTLAQLSRGTLVATARGAFWRDLRPWLSGLLILGWARPSLQLVLADISKDNRDAQSNIMEEGGVPALIGMLSADKSIESQKYAAGALAALAEGSHLNQISIFEEGGIPPLVFLLEATNRCLMSTPHVLSGICPRMLTTAGRCT